MTLNTSHSGVTYNSALVLVSGAVAQQVERWTCDKQVVGSNPILGEKAAYQPWASCLHLCVSVTKHYNLVPAKGR